MRLPPSSALGDVARAGSSIETRVAVGLSVGGSSRLNVVGYDILATSRRVRACLSRVSSADPLELRMAAADKWTKTRTRGRCAGKRSSRSTLCSRSKQPARGPAPPATSALPVQQRTRAVPSRRSRLDHLPAFARCSRQQSRGLQGAHIYSATQPTVHLLYLPSFATSINLTPTRSPDDSSLGTHLTQHRSPTRRSRRRQSQP